MILDSPSAAVGASSRYMLLCIHVYRRTVDSRIDFGLKDVFTVGRDGITNPHAPGCGRLQRKYREEDKHISTELRGNGTVACRPKMRPGDLQVWIYESGVHEVLGSPMLDRPIIIIDDFRVPRPSGESPHGQLAVM